jgi:hypothetical protein
MGGGESTAGVAHPGGAGDGQSHTGVCPFAETPDADAQKQKVEDLFNTGGTASSGMQTLLEDGVEYVFYGPREQEIGNPAWLAELERIGEFGEVRLYKVNSQ